MAEYIDREKAKRLLHIEYAYAAEQLLAEIPTAVVGAYMRIMTAGSRFLSHYQILSG